MRDNLLNYRKRIQKLDEEERISRDLYLRDIALGKIQGPPTGFPSLDKVHLAFFKKEHIEKPIPYMTATQFLKEQNANNLGLIAIDCKEGLISYEELFENIDKTTRSLHKMGVVKGNLIVGMLPADTPHEIYLLYGACQAGSAVSFIVQATPNDTICKTINELPAEYFFVSNDDFSLNIEENLKNLKMRGIDVNIEQKYSWNSGNEFYVFHNYNMVPYDENGCLLGTVEEEKLKRMNKLHGI